MYKESVFSDLFLHFTFRILILQCKEKMRKRLRVFGSEDMQTRKRKMPKALLKIGEHIDDFLVSATNKLEWRM